VLGDGEVDPLEILRGRIRKQLAGRERPLDGRAWRRVYSTMLRAGFDHETVRRELEPYRSDSDPSEDPFPEEMHDEFA
jgi:hypothetical protein